MELDGTDKGILYLLQRDARGLTTQEMAEQVGVSASTVRNRINRMEKKGIIRGYYPDVDYDKAGLQLYVEIICSAPNPERERLVKEGRNVNGVIALREVLNGQENVQIDAVGTESDDVARITDELSDIGLEVINTKIIKETYTQPFSHFGQHLVERDDLD
ncbi:Lrp/AsnC family transcriptional regulator [Natronobacterium texcoconense]|uniref:DNA-binding transcriptional regulator, Lrp family n=1 Tax=Natronobacterium texcoconense TaxID=1095778 RepID=A0A1H1GTL3_NATTX|nr:Lrp/AsnC family transcriptional regulator [Natronobacterium texcoconense]SDR16520.1 DNA-binding transcriptional regulator, Lrp family [Natronobacterium texcoconense]